METMERFLAAYIQEIIRSYPQDRDGQRFQQAYFQYISSGELSFSYRWCVLTYNVGMFFKINRRLDYAEQIFGYLTQVYEKKLSDPTERAQCIGAAGETYDSLANIYNEKNDMLRAHAGAYDGSCLLYGSSTNGPEIYSESRGSGIRTGAYPDAKQKCD